MPERRPPGDDGAVVSTSPEPVKAGLSRADIGPWGISAACSEDHSEVPCLLTW
jgi:hypothetical protein